MAHSFFFLSKPILTHIERLYELLPWNTLWPTYHKMEIYHPHYLMFSKLTLPHIKWLFLWQTYDKIEGLWFHSLWHSLSWHIHVQILDLLLECQVKSPVCLFLGIWPPIPCFFLLSNTFRLWVVLSNCFLQVCVLCGRNISNYHQINLAQSNRPFQIKPLR